MKFASHILLGASTVKGIKIAWAFYSVHMGEYRNEIKAPKVSTSQPHNWNGQNTEKISCLLQSQHLVLGNSLVCSSLLSHPWHLLPGEAAEHAANV